MSEVKTFQNNLFGEIRVADINGAVWFCAMDITRALGYVSGKDAVAKYCRNVTKHDTIVDGVKMQLSYIDRDSLNTLVENSFSPNAREFKKWLLNAIEVKPQLAVLRQTTLLGKTLTVYGTVENPLFLAKDVAERIDYDLSSINKMLDGVDPTEKCLINTRNIFPSIVGNPNKWFLTEDGLYEVVMQSTKPIAKQFKQGVKQILRDIRRHGFYATSTTVENLISDPDTAIKILTAYRDEKVARIKAEEENAILNQTIAEQAPKVLFADALTASNDSVLVRQLAKILQQNGIKMGEKAIFQWLRANGYLLTKGESYNLPSRKAMDMGLFSLKKTPILHSDGKTTVTTTVKITAKGQQYFYNKFVEYEKCSV